MSRTYTNVSNFCPSEYTISEIHSENRERSFLRGTVNASVNRVADWRSRIWWWVAVIVDRDFNCTTGGDSMQYHEADTLPTNDDPHHQLQTIVSSLQNFNKKELISLTVLTI